MGICASSDEETLQMNEKMKNSQRKKSKNKSKVPVEGESQQDPTTTNHNLLVPPETSRRVTTQQRSTRRSLDIQNSNDSQKQAQLVALLEEHEKTTRDEVFDLEATQFKCHEGNFVRCRQRCPMVAEDFDDNNRRKCSMSSKQYDALKATTRTLPPQQVEVVGKSKYCRSAVKKKNSENDLWVILHEKIFDLTEFQFLHPGGVWNVLKHGGLDATAAFEAQHDSAAVWKKLAPYFVHNVEPE